MKRTNGRAMKVVRKAAKDKLKDTIKEAGKAQRRLNKQAESRVAQVEAAVAETKAVEAQVADKTSDAMARLEAQSKRPCVLGERCVFAREGKPRQFTPAITVSGRSTEAHCSVECASKAMGIKIKGYNVDLEPSTEQRASRGAALKAHREKQPVVLKEFAVGSKVKYLGGGNTAKWKEGDIFTVKKRIAEGRRYGLSCDKGTTIIGAKYLEAAKGGKS